VTEQVGWLPTRAGAVFAGLHRPAGPARATAVVLVPPFGWEGMSAARNLRAWARDLAVDGYPSVRYHPPGSGDSAGASADQDLDALVAALVDVIAHTRAATGAARIAVLGLGLGGLVALQAQHDGAAIDDLVLWSVPAKGRLLLRELRAFASLAIEPGESAGAAGPEQTTDGALWVHGYPLGARLQEQLTALDVASLHLAGLSRAHILGRGTLPADKNLIAALRAAEVEVTSAPGLGYDELTVEPRLSRVPYAVQADVQAWLLPDAGTGSPASWGTVPYAEERVDLGEVDAILTRAEDATLTALFIGAGAISRSGPSRLWAEAALRWAELGVSSLRLDLYGIGDAPGPDANPLGDDGFHDDTFRYQVEAVLDRAVELGLPERFLLVGLCSGGFWAGQVAMDDPRAVGVVILNPGSLVWPPPILGTRHILFSKHRWAQFRTDPVLRRDVWARVRRTARLAGTQLRPTTPRSLRRSVHVLEALEANGTHVTVALSAGEMNDMALDGRPGVVHHFDGSTQAHTLSPVTLRMQTAALLDAKVREVLTLVDSQTPAS
jgi:alpha-beta hydrolase superfamily lysophospholipase